MSRKPDRAIPPIADVPDAGAAGDELRAERRGPDARHRVPDDDWDELPYGGARTGKGAPTATGWWQSIVIVGAAVALVPIALILPLRWVNPATTSYMLQSPVTPVRQRWVASEQLGVHLPLAAIASEDQRFASHAGFDIEAIEAAWASRGERRRGASTISQQTVKNLYLWPGGWLRKGIEAVLTVYLEILVPKHRILTIYLNIAEFGPGVYGVAAGAQHHFGRAPRQLSPTEAAQLIAVLPDPRDLDPNPPSQYVQDRAQWIVEQMEQLGQAALPPAMHPLH